MVEFCLILPMGQILQDFRSTHTGPHFVFSWTETFVLAEFMLKEMALGFTSDIAKNNLGESFYRLLHWM